MARYKPEVNFRGKEMGLLEARLYTLGLKLGIVNINLNEEEERCYLMWRNYREMKNKMAKECIEEQGRERFTKEDVVFKDLSERKYLIESLENKLISEKLTKNKIYCKEHGHKEEKNSAYTSPGIEGAVTHYACSRCGDIYEKESTSYEDKNINKPIYNPFRG